jgi:hypothetical protein
VAISKWSSLLTQLQDNTRCIVKHGPPQVDHQELRHVGLMWVTCNHTTFCKENPSIIHNITFSSLPLRLTSSQYIWISPFHTMAMHYIIIHACIPLVIVLLILFKIFFATNLLIAFRNILFISLFIHGIRPKLPNEPFHTIFKYINHFTT